MKPNRKRTMANLSLMVSILTRSTTSTRGVLRGFDGQDYIVLVQHLVVLEIVQQRGRHEVRVAGKEYRGA